MRLIKPRQMGYLQRTYGIGKDYFYVASPIVFFSLHTGELLVENQQWSKVTTALPDQALDQGFPKAQGEFLLAGHAYAPKEESDTFCVSVRLGKTRKALKVSGARRWKQSIWRGTCVSDPQAIDNPVALNWENAYGGDKFPLNPQGTGYLRDSAIPQVEALNTELSRPKCKRAPGCFLPLPITWPQRAVYQGKYKRNYVQTSFPAFAPSTDPKLFNAALSDQHVQGYFDGDESYCLENVNAGHPNLEGQLPGVVARVFLNADGAMTELPSRLDTVWFMPDQLLGALVFRAQTSVRDMEALEVHDVLLALEALKGPQRDVAHYQSEFTARTTPETALAKCMNDQPLLPPLDEEQHAIRAAKVETQREMRKQQMREQQVAVLATCRNPAVLSSAPLPEPELVPADDILEEDLQSGNVDLAPLMEHAAQQSEQANSEADEKWRALEARYPQTKTEPVISVSLQDATQNLDSSHAPGSEKQTALLATQQTIQGNEQADVDPCAAQFMREQIVQRLQDNMPLAGLNLTGADLSQLIFNNVDMREVILTFANLSGARFISCQMDKASLVNALLDRAAFEQCTLSEAQFSGAVGHHVTFERCQLHHLLCRSAKLNNGAFLKCSLSQMTVQNTDLSKSIINECDIQTLTVSQSNLSDSDLLNNQLSGCVFSEGNLQMCRWQGSELTRCVMQQCDMQLSVFEQTHANKWVFSTGTTALGSLWYQATIQQSSLRSLAAIRMRMIDSQFFSCDFSLALLHQNYWLTSAVSGCILAQANLTGATLSQCNLYQSRFRATLFEDAHLHGCNLLDADFMWAQWQSCELHKCTNMSLIAQRDLKNRDSQRRLVNG